MKHLIDMTACNGSGSCEKISLEKVHDKSSEVVKEVLNLERVSKRRWQIDLITQRHKRQEVIEGSKVLGTRLDTGRTLNV